MAIFFGYSYSDLKINKKKSSGHTMLIYSIIKLNLVNKLFNIIPFNLITISI